MRIFNPVSGEVGTVLGTRDVFGVMTGAAPGALNGPTGLAALSSGELLVVDTFESVLQIAD